MKKENQMKLFIGLNAIFFVLTILTDMLYIIQHNPYVFKTLASVTFVVWSLLNLILMLALKNTLNSKFMICMFLGQVLACLGDILLIDNFLVGAIFFALGHIMFFISYLFLQKFNWWDLLYFGVAVAISTFVILISRVELGEMAVLIFVYAVIISIMVAKSATLFKGNKIIASVIFVGSLMFFLSDMFLMFCIFGGFGRIFDLLCLLFYYPAEFVLASSIGVVGICSNNTNKSNS